MFWIFNCKEITVSRKDLWVGGWRSLRQILEDYCPMQNRFRSSHDPLQMHQVGRAECWMFGCWICFEKELCLKYIWKGTDHRGQNLEVAFRSETHTKLNYFSDVLARFESIWRKLLWRWKVIVSIQLKWTREYACNLQSKVSSMYHDPEIDKITLMGMDGNER